MVYRNHTMAEDEFEYFIFEKNLQGDIVAVYTVFGTKFVSYTYDAWGNVSSLYHNNGASTAARYNSFRYRGYFYDEETGLYYLNSRYYDPATGRFINADIFVNANGDLTGFNMFAYCSNNPVMFGDPTGMALSTYLNDMTGSDMWDYTSNGGGPYDHCYIVEDKLGDDIKMFDWDNTSERVVLDAHFFSAYKGKLVIKLPIGYNAFSFGIIIMGEEPYMNPDVVKHEYGHTLQFDKMGPLKYITDVAIPSVTLYLLDKHNKLPYNYYTYPFEAEANEKGGANLSQSGSPALPEDGYNSYWDIIKYFFR